eukprot:13500425-Alexandrium_andersonii.AAC.1
MLARSSLATQTQTLLPGFGRGLPWACSGLPRHVAGGVPSCKRGGPGHSAGGGGHCSKSGRAGEPSVRRGRRQRVHGQPRRN